MHTKVRQLLEARAVVVPAPSCCFSLECMHGCMPFLLQKLMVSLAECNFYGALGIVRQAIQNADEPGGSWRDGRPSPPQWVGE